MPIIDFNKLATVSSLADTIGTKPIDDNTGTIIDFSKPLPKESPLSGTTTGSGVSFTKKYGKITGPVTPAIGEQYYQRLAAGEQTSIEQFGAFLNQAVIGEIVGGTLEGIGHLLDIKQYYDLARGKEVEFGNFITDIGKSFRTWSEETTPIHIDPNQKKFAPGHWSWWMSNGKSVASTLSLLIPATGTMRALGYVGKALGVSKELAAVSKAMGLSAKFLPWAAEGIGSAVVSRHMESLMEASGVREETINDMMQLGMSRVEAERYGNEAATNTYNKNWVMLLQDIPEYLTYTKFLSKASGRLTVDLAKKLKLPAGPVLGKKIYDNIAKMAGEGLEEGYQFIVGEESKYLAKGLADPEYAKTSNFANRFGKYLKDGEFWTNVSMGALGAGVAMGATSLIGKYSKGERLTEDEQRVKNIYDYGTLFSQNRSALSRAKELGDEDGVYRSALQMKTDILARAASTKGLNDARTFINNIQESAYSTDELQSQFNMSEEDAQFVKENFPEFAQEADQFEELFNKYANNKNNPVSATNASLLAKSEFLLNKLKERQSAVEERIFDAQQEITGYDNLSITGKSLLDTFSILRSKKRVASLLQDRISNAKENELSEEEVARDSKELGLYNSEIKVLEKLYQESLDDYNSKDNVDKKEDTAKGINLEELTKESVDEKDKDVPTSRLYNLIKANSSKGFLDLSIKRAQENYNEDYRAFGRGVFGTEEERFEAISGLHKEYKTKFNTYLDTLLKSNKLDQATKDRIKTLLDRGANPLTLLSRPESILVLDKELSSKINPLIDKDTQKEITKNSIEYINDLFYYTFGRHRGEVFGDEKTQLTKEINNLLLNELNKDYIPEQETLPEDANAEVDKTEIVKGSNSTTNIIKSNLSDTSANEVIPVEKLYTDPLILDSTLPSLFEDGVERIYVIYKGVKGYVDRRKGEKNTVYYTFTAITEDNKIGKSITFESTQKKVSIRKLDLFPLRETTFDITNPTPDSISIGGLTLRYYPAQPLKSIKENENGDPIEITVFSNKKPVTFTKPLIVQELAYHILKINQVRYELYDSFRLNENHGLYVTHPATGKKYVVYSNGESWEVYDPIEKKRIPSITIGGIGNTVINTLFEELEKLLNIEKGKRDEYRQTIERVQRPSDKEINQLPPTPEISFTSYDSKRKIKQDDSSKHDGAGLTDKLESNEADRLGSNLESNKSQVDVTSEIELEEDTTIGLIAEEQITDATLSIEVINTRKYVNLDNKFKDAPILNDYLENPKNNTVGDSIEFYIDFENEIYWKDKQDLLNKIKSKSLSKADISKILSVAQVELSKEAFDNLVDTIPIKTRYSTSSGKVIGGYYLPASNTLKIQKIYEGKLSKDVEKSRREEQLERISIRHFRADVLKILLSGNIAVSNKFTKNIGEPNNWESKKADLPTQYNNIATELQQSPESIDIGIADERGVIHWTDGTELIGESSSSGNVFFKTDKTCNGNVGVLKCNPIKLTSEHAEDIIIGYEYAHSSPKKFDEYHPNAYTLKDGKQSKMKVSSVINTLVNNGKDTLVTGKKANKTYLLPKQLYYENGVLFYGDYTLGGEHGGIVEFSKRKSLNPKEQREYKEQREAFKKYATSYFSYPTAFNLLKKKYNYSIHIGSLVLNEGETTKAFLIRNGLLTTDSKRTKYGTMYVTPRLRVEQGSVVQKDTGTIEPDIEKEKIKETADQVDRIEPTADGKITSASQLSSLRKGDILKHTDIDTTETFAVVKEDEGGLYLDVILQSFENEYINKIYLTDKVELERLFDSQTKGYFAGDDSRYFSVANLPVVDNITKEETTEKKKSTRDIIDEIDGDGVFMEATKPLPEANMEEEIEDVKKILSGFDIKLVNRIIKITKDGSRTAWGKFTNDLITIYNKAPKGTVYHEAFHRVYLLYLTPQERNIIHKEAINRYKLSKNATMREVSEVVAEKFREFILSNKPAEAEPRNIASFFRQLVEFIVTFVTGRTRVSQLTIDKLFTAVEKGKFKYARPRRENAIRFSGEEYLSEAFTPKQIDSIVNTMMYNLFTSRGITYVEDLNKLKEFESIKEESLQFFSKKLVRFYKAQENDKDNQVLQNRINFYNSVIQNFGFLMEAFKSKLNTLGIREKESYLDDGESYYSDEFSTHEEGLKIANIDKSTFEFNHADKVLANIKFFVQTVPISEERDPVSGLYTYADFNTLWSKLLYDIWKFDNIHDMIDFMKTKATRDKDPFYNLLVYGSTDPKTNKITRVGLANADERLKTQFHQSFNKFRYTFMSMFAKDTIVDDKIVGSTYKIVDTSSDKQASDVTKEWSFGFRYTKLFEENSSAINQGGVGTAIKFYTKLEEAVDNDFDSSTGELNNFSTHTNRLVTLFKYIGVNISEVTLLAYLQELADVEVQYKNIHEVFVSLFRRKSSAKTPEAKGGYLADIFKFDKEGSNKSLLSSMYFGEKLKTKDGKETSYSDALRSKTIIKELSTVFSRVDIEKLSDIVFGPDGNMYYNYAENSYVTDFVKQINNPESGLIEEIESDPNSGRSYFLNQIKEGAKLEIVTYSSFKNTAYKNLDAVDDFKYKFHMMMDNYIPLPTLADKPTFHMYKGLKRFDIGRGTIDVNFNYSLSDDSYNFLLDYIRDEVRRVKKAKAEVDWAEKNNDYSHLIENFHYLKTKENGTPILKENGEYTGNGTKYLHFGLFNKSRYNSNIVQEHFNKRIQETLKYAEELGIITIIRSETTNDILNIQNNTLDKNLVENTRLKYELENQAQAIVQLMADYTFNTVIANLETEKLMTGDLAFYKDATDLAKRISSTIAPGSKLRVDNTFLGGKATYRTTVLKTREFNDKKIIEQLRKAFTKQVRDSYTGKEVSEETITNIVDALLASYTKVNATDGQAWITPQFHKELLERLGEWTPEMEKAFDLLLDTTKELTLEEDIKLRAIVMQPLKFVYFGNHIDPDLKLRYPIYDKMSMATLFPRQVKDTKLEALYNWMVKDNVEMVKFDSATKVGRTKPTVYFDSEHNTLVEALDNAVIKEQKLANLRRQQITTPYDENIGLLATQVKKVLADMLKDMAPLLSELSDRGKAKLNDILGVDSRGNIDMTKLFKILKDYAKLSKLPQDVIDVLQTDENGNPFLNIDTLIDSKWIESRLISMVNKFNINTNIPGNAYFQATSYGTEAVGASPRLKMIGNSGAIEVILSIGLYKHVIPNYNNLSFEEAKNWVIENQHKLEGISYRIPTQGPNMVTAFRVVDVLPEYTGNTILVPYSFVALTESDFDIDKLYLYIYNYTRTGDGDVITEPFHREEIFENGKITRSDIITTDKTLKKLYNANYGRKISLLNKLKEIMTIAKYRSNFSEKVKKELTFEEARELQLQLEEELSILTENWNEITILPSHVQHRINVLEKEIPTLEEYINTNRNKTALELNTKEAVQNRLLDIYTEYLKDEDYYTKTKMPLATVVNDFKDLSSHIQELEGIKEEHLFLESVSPVFQHKTRTIYLTAKSGVGPFALNVVHHTMGMAAGLKLATYIGIGNGSSELGTDLSQDVAEDDTSIFNTLAALVSANVDAPKDPYIYHLNVNPTTWGVTNLLVRAGVGNNTFLYLAQPILKEYVAASGEPWQKFRKVFDKYNNLLSRYKPDYKIENGAIISKYGDPKNIFNKEQLERNISTTQRNNVTWVARQLAILQYYERLNRAASTLRSAVTYSQVDTNRYGSNLTSAFMFARGLQKMLQNENLVNQEKIFTNTFLQKYRENGLDYILQMFKGLTLGTSEAYLSTLNMILNELGPDGYQAIKSISKELMSVIKADYFNSSTGANVTKDSLKKLLSGEEALALQLYKIKTGKAGKEFSSLQNNLLVNYLLSYLDDKSSLWFFETPKTDSEDVYYRERLINAYKDILTSTEPKVRELGIKLFVYSFYTSGLNRSQNSINHTIPHKLFKDALVSGGISLDDMIKEAMFLYNDVDYAAVNVSRLRKDFYLNNWENDKIVPTISHALSDANNPIRVNIKDKDGKIVDQVAIVFTLNTKELIANRKRNPYVKYKHDNGETYLYEVFAFNVDEETKFHIPIYRLINKKGFSTVDGKHKVKEYGFTGDSIIDANNTPYEYSVEKITSDIFKQKNKEGKLKFPSYQNVVLSNEFGLATYETTDVMEEQEVLVEEPTTEQTSEVSTTIVPTIQPKTGKIKYKVAMNFSDGTNGDKMRPEFKGKSTMDLILSGNRTATSRDLSKTYNNLNIEPGDVIQFYDNNGRTANVVVTQGFIPIEDIIESSDTTPENEKLYNVTFSKKEQLDIEEDGYTDEHSAKYWSKLEGWDESVYYKLLSKNEDGANYQQFQYRLLQAGEIEAKQQNLFEQSVSTEQTTESPFESDLNISKIKLIPEEWQFDPKYKNKYDALIKAANNINTTLKDMQDLIKHEKIC